MISIVALTSNRGKVIVMHYFAYGQMARREVIEALLGRPVTSLTNYTHSAHIKGFALVTQKLCHIPNSPVLIGGEELPPRTILKRNYGDEFASYAMRTKQNGMIYGEIWDIHPDERRLIEEWEFINGAAGWFHGYWAMVIYGESRISCQTEIIPREAEFHEVIETRAGEWPEPLVDLRTVLAKANDVNADFYERNPR